MNSIVVVDKHWGIGRNNGLLFDLKEDMKHFVAHTRGKIVVMGSNTLLSLPGAMPLKNRVNVVLDPEGDDADAKAKGFKLAKSLPGLFELLRAYPSEDVYIIGGAMTYRTLLPYCDTAYVTKVDADGDACVFYENLDLLDEWTLTEIGEEIEDNGLNLRFCTYKNSAPKPLTPSGRSDDEER